jgi:hypothetical protein
MKKINLTIRKNLENSSHKFENFQISINWCKNLSETFSQFLQPNFVIGMNYDDPISVVDTHKSPVELGWTEEISLKIWAPSTKVQEKFQKKIFNSIVVR